MISSVCDKTYVITTANSSRVNYIKNHLNERGIQFEFFVAPKFELFIPNHFMWNQLTDTRPVLSLLGAYYSIMEMCNISGVERVAIIEDDCYLVPDWVHRFENFYNNVPDNWDLLNVGWHPLHETETVKENINQYVSAPKNWHHTTHFMMVSSNVYSFYKSVVDDNNWSYPADYAFNEIYKNNNYKSYMPNEHIAYQLSYRSSLTELDHVGSDVQKFQSIVQPL